MGFAFRPQEDDSLWLAVLRVCIVPLSVLSVLMIMQVGTLLAFKNYAEQLRGQSNDIPSASILRHKNTKAGIK
tara:strand:- start:2 stop:220 length:219 start_codon:yes stop_codon:yes gene_type:complete